MRRVFGRMEKNEGFRVNEVMVGEVTLELDNMSIVLEIYCLSATLI